MGGSFRHSEEMQVQVEHSRSALVSIATSVNTITDMTQQVAAAAEEQSHTSNEIALLRKIYAPQLICASFVYTLPA